MEQQLIHTQTDNHARVFLRRYRALALQCDALNAAIEEANERATNITVRLTPDKVQSSGVHDRMAEEAVRVTDMVDMLTKAQEQAHTALSEILAVINAVPDEMQRTILIMRYVNGMAWPYIEEAIGYERTQTLVYHGRALRHVEAILQKCG